MDRPPADVGSPSYWSLYPDCVVILRLALVKAIRPSCHDRPSGTNGLAKRGELVGRGVAGAWRQVQVKAAAAGTQRLPRIVRAALAAKSGEAAASVYEPGIGACPS